MSSANRSEKKSRFVTFQNSFHPEAAASNLATVTGQHGVVHNKWGTVWAEATLILDPNEAATSATPPSIAVAVDDEEASVVSTTAPPVNPDCITGSNHANAAVESVSASPSTTTAPEGAFIVTTIEAPYYHGHCLDTILGVSMTSAAISATFGFELASIVLYSVANGFFQAALLCKCEGRGCTLLLPLYGIFQLVCSLLMVTDATLLSVSIIVTELLAQTTWLLTSCFGGCKIGAEWHQYIRKLCHLTRWAFRGDQNEGEPRRVFLLFRTSPDTVGSNVNHGANEKGTKCNVPVERIITME